MTMWSEDRVALLRKLFDRDLSGTLMASELSEETGDHYTKGMIIGKLHRLKLRRFGRAVHSLHVRRGPDKRPRGRDPRFPTPPKPGRIMALAIWWGFK